MDPLESQDSKTEESRPAVVGTTSDFQIDSKPTRTRFDLSDKHPVDFPRRKYGLQRQRNGSRLEDEAKLEGEQPSSWFCFAPDIATPGSQTQTSSQQKAAERFSKRHVRRGKDSVSIPQSNLPIADNDTDDYGLADDMSGVVSAVTTKTPVATNRGKKLDLLQPIYDRMGIYSKKDKKGLRDAFADLLFIVR